MVRRDVSAPRVNHDRVVPGRYVNGHDSAPVEWTAVQSICNIPVEVAYQLQIAWIRQLFSNLAQCHCSECDTGAEGDYAGGSGCRGTFKLVVGGRAGTALPWTWRRGSDGVEGWSRMGLPRDQNKNPLILSVYSNNDIDNRLRWIDTFTSKVPRGWIYVVKTACLNVPLVRRYEEGSLRETDTLSSVSNVGEYMRVEWVEKPIVGGEASAGGRGGGGSTGDGGGKRDRGGDGGARDGEGSKRRAVVPLSGTGGQESCNSKKLTCRKYPPSPFFILILLYSHCRSLNVVEP